MPTHTAKLFANGHSQAVRLPHAFRFKGDEVFIRKVGDDVILSPRPTTWDDFFTSPATVSDDFLSDRKDAPPQDRESF